MKRKKNFEKEPSIKRKVQRGGEVVKKTSSTFEKTKRPVREQGKSGKEKKKKTRRSPAEKNPCVEERGGAKKK